MIEVGNVRDGLWCVFGKDGQRVGLAAMLVFLFFPFDTKDGHIE